jgi:chromosome partitioning protein
VGKSSVACNLLASGAQAGHAVIGLDLDSQETLMTWARRREKVRAAMPGLPAIPVIAKPLEDWREGLTEAKATGAALVVIDTPPSIELNGPAIAALSQAATLTLVPSAPTQIDFDSTGPWMTELRQGKTHASFVLNKANARTKSYTTIRAKMLAMGALCPMEIPTLEEVHTATAKGLGVLDLAKAKSADTFEGLWNYVRLELRLA